MDDMFNQEYEDELITSLFIIRGHEGCQPPYGYEKIPMDLKKGSKGEYMYLCYKIGGSENPITDIIVRTGYNGGDDYQHGYQGVESGFMVSPTDLNKDRGGAYIYPLFSRNPQQRPIQSLKIGYGDATYEGYTKVESDLNYSQGGAFVFLFIKRV